MIKILQRKFVFAAMIAVSILLIASLGTINLANTIMTSNQTDNLLDEIITDELNQSSQPPNAPNNINPGSDPMHFSERNMSSVFFVARVNNSGEVVQLDISRITTMTEDEAENITLQAIELSENSGKISGFKYTSMNDGIGKVYVFLDVSYQTYSVLTVLFLSVLIGLICWVLMLILVIFLSKKAIKPIAENIERQKQFVIAVEGVEEAFLERNYSGEDGELYKPDSSEMGGGRGNGKNFEMEQWSEEDSASENENSDTTESTVDENTPPDMMENPFGNNTEFAPGQNGTGQEGQMMPPGMENSQGFEQSSEDSSISEDTQPFSDSQSDSFGGDQEFSGRGSGGFGGNMGGGEMPEGMTPPDMNENGDTAELPDNQNRENFGGGGMGSSMGSDDVSLIYTDDNYGSYSNIFDNAKTDITDEDKDRLIQALKNINENVDIENSVDVDEAIRYFVVHNFVLNFDSYTGSMIHNYYLYESDGQLSMIPWDYNLAFGGFQSAADATSLVNYPIDSPVSGGTIDSRPMLAWIFSNEEYTQMYHEYFNEFITEIFDSGVFSEMMDSVKEIISPYVEADPTKFCTYDEFLTGIDTLKEFCLLRAESISGQLDGTIGSTSEEQQDKENFVDASGISISDMGTMNNSMGGMMNNDFSGEGGDFSMREQQPSSEDSSSNMQISNTADINSSEETNEVPPTEIPTESSTGEEFPNNANGNMMPGNRGNMNFSMDNQFSESTSQTQSNDIILIIVTILVLTAGLAFAFIFKRR